MSEKQQCCYIEPTTISTGYGSQCAMPAEWTIVFGDGPDDYTEACAEHVGKLLTPGVNNVVFPAGDDETF